jgi:2-polyprenyl-3-methyl-5-hydroxy-6-metoxy-1,4-benzoquinol methylase
MEEKDSKKLWLEFEQEYIPKSNFSLGPYTTQGYLEDPACHAFMTSRYKFCSRMLSDLGEVLDIGCGDGFGGAIVSQKVGKLLCTDINAPLLKDNEQRMSNFPNIAYSYHDFRSAPHERKFDAIYLVDVIEHIFTHEENRFLENICLSLKDNGICLIGTPNKTAEKFASKFSKEAHVNLKDEGGMRTIGKTFFENSFLFGMNDEIVHTGYPAMSHYLWIMCVGPKRKVN